MNGPQLIGKVVKGPAGPVRVVGCEDGTALRFGRYNGWLYLVAPMPDAAAVGRLPVPTPTYTINAEDLQKLQA